MYVSMYVCMSSQKSVIYKELVILDKLVLTSQLETLTIFEWSWVLGLENDQLHHNYMLVMSRNCAYGSVV